MSELLRRDDAPLTICLDLRHPFSYLALAPALEFAAARGFALNWVPIEVPPLNPPSTPGPDDDRGIRHRRARAQALAREIACYAEAQGLVLKDPYRTPSPEVAHRAWAWVRETAPDTLDTFLISLFQAYWAGGLDPSDASQLGLLLRAGGYDSDAFDAWSAAEGAATMEALSQDLQAHGIGGTPAYLVEDEVFLGRQHLPMIEWILGGRVGPGPI